nr:unnamed protein product [Callosobruchus analis]
MVKNNILSNCFESYGLMQVISEPTRITETSSTLIDIIFVSNVEKCIAKGTINADTISDHFLVYCEISCDYKKTEKYVTYRDFKNFSLDLFLCGLHSIPWENILIYRDIETKVEFLTKNIIGLFDIHCPTKTARVTKARAPWISQNTKLLFKERNRALQKFRSNKTSSNWNEYKVLRNFALSSLRNEKSAYLRHLHNLSNSSSFYKTLKYMHVQVNSKSAEIPKHLKNPHKVNDYFTSTFQNSDLECSDSIFFYRTNKFQESCSFSLTTVDLGTVLNVITNIKSNAGGVDGVTLQMLKLCFPVIGKWILHIINICLERGYFPSCWKVAVVTPLPKVHNPKSLNDLRPISLLPVLSKVLERIVYLQICDYLNRHNIIPVHQSGFQKNLSSTTALAYLADTIITAIDKNNMSLLVLLDFTKAFDTLNHKLLVAKCCYYGFDDTSCKFIKSYLSGRKQKVVIEDQSSLLNNIKSGVPQGSVLGPLLFLLYTSDIVNQVQYSHLQLFADDTQISHTFSATQYLIAEQNINNDLNNIKEYCQSHNLRLNPSKCNALLFGNKSKRQSLKNRLNVQVNGESIPFIDCARNLGLHFDENLRFERHVQMVLKGCYATLRLLYANRDILDKTIRKKLCESLVMSKINYALAVYYPCLTTQNTRRLQIMQNTCSRLINNLRKFDHISHTLYEMKWLNVKNLYKYSCLSLTHKVVTSSFPRYLKQKLTTRSSVHDVPVRNTSLLTMPLHRTATFTRSFTYNSVSHYNRLHEDIKKLPYRSFKRRLKSVLLLQQ